MEGPWLAEIAADYIANYRQAAATELAHYRDLQAEAAITQAALSRDPQGRKHSHQRRIPAAALEESEKRLLDDAESLSAAVSFHQLLKLVNTSIRPVARIGELAVYDTALRIGAHLRLEPEKVYLHRGTREGAAALGLGAGQAWLDMNELPAELTVLTARECEDALCIYKPALREMARHGAFNLRAIRACGTRYRRQQGRSRC